MDKESWSVHVDGRATRSYDNEEDADQAYEKSIADTWVQVAYIIHHNVIKRLER